MSAMDLDRLYLLILRTLDTEALCESDGGALLILGEAALRAQESGDRAGARSQVRQLVRLARALVSSDALAPEDGREVLQAASRILSAR